MIVECNYCNAHVETHTHGSCEILSNGKSPSVKYSLVQCCRCQSPLLASQLNIGSLTEGDIWSLPNRMFPSPEYRVDNKVPEPIKTAFEEAVICFRNRAYTATAILCRKTLEGVCRQFSKNSKSDTLMKSLKKLKDDNLIDDRLFQWADVLRSAGNDAAHNVDVTVLGDDARDILDFTNAILDYIFRFREQFENFKSRRDK